MDHKVQTYCEEESYAIVDLDSDPEDYKAQDSSDDDIDVLLHGTLEQRRRLRRRSLGQRSSSSEDEFEKEMREELDETMRSIEQKQGSGLGTSASAEKGEKRAAQQFYDDAYFDSDSDDDVNVSKEEPKEKHPIPSNDDLLYDPSIDDDNQKWIDRQRRRYQPRAPPGDASRQPPGGEQRPKAKALPRSDAVLNCPACMTVLCLDCQRHATYQNQYRAMFVMNCQVDDTEILKYPLQSGKKKNKQRKRPKADEQTADEQNASAAAADNAQDNGESCSQDSDVDVYHPVRCSSCTTEVGVRDKEELYHFFNVLTSYS